MAKSDLPPEPDDQDPTDEFDMPPADAASESHETDPPADTHQSGHFRGLTRVVIKGVLGVLLIFLIAADPYAYTGIEEIVGFGLIVFGLFELFIAIRDRRHLGHLVQPAVAIGAGVILWVWPEQTLEVAGYFLGGVIALRGLLDLWAGIRRWHESGANTWVFIRGLIALLLAGLVFLLPSQAVTAVVIGGAALAAAQAVLTVWFVVANRGAASTIDPSDTYAVVTYWLSRKEMDADDAGQIDKRVFLHLGNGKERVGRFAILMILATGIATFGIATDSTAVVIGAMLVAPLMTPILGIAAGLINSRPKSTLISAAIVAGGSLGAVAIAWLLASAIPDLQAVAQDSQVTSRTSPSLLDLAIAIFAGAAGAYGVSREESSDALPGVAVAIALVPPLAVIGITLRATDYAAASGALLLFLTNFLSIVLMAGLVFIMVGYGTWGRLYQQRNRIRASFALVAFAVVLVTIPLALTAQSVVQQSNDLRHSSDAVEDWLGEDTELRVNDLEVDGSVVTIQLVGPQPPPPAVSLSDMITDKVGRTMTAIVRWIEEHEEVGRTVFVELAD